MANEHASAPPEGYEVRSFEHAGDTRPVFHKGTGPAVLVMTEIPGITPPVLAFCEHVLALGCSVALPQFLGTPGRPFSAGYMIKSMTKVCVSREFTTFVRGRSSPITVWMRALARALHREHGGPGVGVVGMCLTGGFALATLAEPAVIAPVLSQPSLPFGLSEDHRSDLGLSPEDLVAARDRVCEQGIPLLGLRFSHDSLCPPQRFERLKAEFGDAVKLIEIDSSEGNAHGLTRRAHSVLGHDFVDEAEHPTRQALDEVLTLFEQQLLTTG